MYGEKTSDLNLFNKIKAQLCLEDKFLPALEQKPHSPSDEIHFLHTVCVAAESQGAAICANK
jgi:hypothetical protein